jgi:mannose-6-phosphate isomerase-like protein (cupin superfamily)
VFTGLDGSTANLHVTHITDSLRHYHKQCTEYYYVLEGSGTIELGDEEYPLSPGTVVRIDPMTPHRAYGNLTTIVFGVPAWNPDDEYYLTDAPDTTGAAV